MSNAKYRGKRVSDGDFVVGNLVNAVNGKVYIVTMWDNTGTYEDRPRIMFVEVIPETVGQYTGMEDKSRKEIYEGDKVAVCDDEYGIVSDNCYRWLSESEIDDIIIKPKRNIDHLIELWESHREEDARKEFIKLTDNMSMGAENGDEIYELMKPYALPSRYPKLTPEELRAVKWLVEGGFEGLGRGCLGAVVAVKKNCIRVVMNEMPVCKVLLDSTWFPKESQPINLAELIAAQEEL